jgi:gamma-glutamyltranspeptidase / glutathione hydrolase
VRAREILAVAARRITVQAGLDVMAEGGNAVDAAVCMAFVAAVVEPSEAAIGGSGFLLLDDPGRDRPISIEFPPRAPLAAHPGLAERTRPGSSGALMPCVPGLVAGLCLAHRQLGSLARERLLEPAVAAAEDGFEVDEYLCLQTLDNLQALRADPEAARIFLHDGLPPVPQFAIRRPDRPRPVLRQPDLASTLRAIARRGPEGFYRGDVAEAIAEAFAARGGVLRVADLALYRASAGPARCARYRDWELHTPAAPCGGSAVTEALGYLERVDPGELGAASIARLHHTALALRAAFARRYDHGGKLDLADAGHGTTHLCAVDRWGRLVTCTITLGETFGSKFVAPGTGVLFDSGLAWFDPGADANSIAPGKRPLVNMCPLLLVAPDGRRVGIGAAGGRRIISAVTQVVSGIVDRGLSVREAVEAPRLDASEGPLLIGDRLPRETAEALRRRGHDVVAVAEEHAPFSYEFARPAAADIAPDGTIRGAIHPFATGYVAGR